MPFAPFLDYTFYQNIFKSIDSFLWPKYGTHAIIIIFHLWGFLSVRDAGSRGNKIAGIDLMLTCSVTLTFLTTLQTMLSKTDTFRYTCQLFLRYKRKIFILGVLGFLKTTRSFLKIPEEVRSLPKTSEVCRRRSYRENTYPQNQEGIVIYSFYTWFSFLTWVWVNIFLEIVSSKTAITHIFQSGVRNWPASVNGREIEVFNPQAWDSRLRHESWQVYL